MKRRVLAPLIVLLWWASSAEAQPRHWGLWAPFAPPDREMNVSLSAVSMQGDATVTALTASYTRAISEIAAIEGALDVGSDAGLFGIARAQLRVQAGPGRPGFITLGLAYGQRPRGPSKAPVGPGYSVGGGFLLPVTDAGALRMEVALGEFRGNQITLRASAGFTIGFR